MPILARWLGASAVLACITVTPAAIAAARAATDVVAELAALKAEVAKLSQRQAIHEVYVRYGRGIDRLDESAYRSAFWPDAQINYGTAQSISVNEHWSGHMIGYHKAKLKTWAHAFSNETVNIDGDVAHVEIYFLRLWVPKKTDPKLEGLVGGRYIDKLERRNGEWRIAVREFMPHFAIKSESNFDEAWGFLFKNTNAECVKEPFAPIDPSYVRPLRKRTKEAGPPCAK